MLGQCPFDLLHRLDAERPCRGAELGSTPRWQHRNAADLEAAEQRFLAKNGVELDPDDDAAYEFVIAAAPGQFDEVGEIAEALASFARDDRSS